MMKNEQGFTVVELVLSFLFVAIVSISLYAVVVNYKEKTQLMSIREELVNFKTNLTVDIEKDIQKYFLKNVEYCDDDSRTKCVNLTFADDSEKKLEIKNKIMCDAINLETRVVEDCSTTEWANKTSEEKANFDEFTYTMYYITYGDVVYEIPDHQNVTIDGRYLLEYTRADDGIENGVKLFRIHIGLKHSDMDELFDITIVSNGAETYPELTGDDAYKSYSIGDRVVVRVNASDDYIFRVIEDSGESNAKVTLLYDDDTISGKEPYEIVKSLYNLDIADGNAYDSSYMKLLVDDLGKTATNVPTRWSTPDEIRLITVEEIIYIVEQCPTFMGANSEDISIVGTTDRSWLYNTTYWTMTPYYGTLEDNASRKVWYVDKTGKLKKADVNIVDSSQPAVRPVISISKDYISKTL